MSRTVIIQFKPLETVGTLVDRLNDLPRGMELVMADGSEMRFMDNK